MNRILLGLAAATVVLFASAAPTQASNLIVNGGFESGDLTGWTISGDTSFTSVDFLGHSGDFAFWMGPVDDLGFLAQSSDFATEVGATYQFDFWLHSLSSGPNFFSAAFNSGATTTTVYSITDADPFDDYIHIVASVVATSTTSNVTFSFYNPPSFFLLDDVNVNFVSGPTAVVPEPASLTLLGLGALGLAGYGVRRRKVAA